ncbi:hypothetical protein D352_01333 [Enterococcus faecium LA4B-2]|nr:hypothetical protein HMPREF1347_00664 [Enterococcus faecium 504]EPI22626.1 hypothetical protein D352_01333 [Enterococcus faecium LA4B-2]
MWIKEKTFKSYTHFFHSCFFVSLLRFLSFPQNQHALLLLLFFLTNNK